MTTMQPINPGLAELERRVRFELDCLGYPARPWTIAGERNGTEVHDVIIVGGGQSGVSIAFRLLRERVTHLRVLDRNPRGLEGPWLSFARMHSLRTPKVVTGPDLGIASLSARAWWEACFGEASWQGLNKIPREQWQAYLSWLRNIIGIEVSNHAEVSDIEPLDDGLLAVHATIGGVSQTLLARKVVLATGIEGSGRWFIPSAITQALPRQRYAHTSEPIDFASLQGKAVAVIGAGASAFDNAATALENGAASVELFARRKQLPTVNPNRWMEFSGFLRHFGDLDDIRKWRFMKIIFDMNQPPPQETFDRCTRFGNFAMRLAAPLEHVRFENEKILLTTPQGTQAFDFLIAGTGLAVDLASRPELARFHDKDRMLVRPLSSAGRRGARAARRLPLSVFQFPVHREGAGIGALSRQYFQLHLCGDAEPCLLGRHLRAQIRRRPDRHRDQPRAVRRGRRRASAIAARL
jgi:FAD-dependent urate hydroxylase